MGWRAHLRYCDHRRAQRRRSRRRAVDHLSYLHPARRPAPAPPTCGTRHSSAPSTLKVPIGFVCSARPRLHTNRLHVRRRGRTQRCEGTQRSLTNFRHFCTDPTHPGLRYVGSAHLLLSIFARCRCRYRLQYVHPASRLRFSLTLSQKLYCYWSTLDVPLSFSQFISGSSSIFNGMTSSPRIMQKVGKNC